MGHNQIALVITGIAVVISIYNGWCIYANWRIFKRRHKDIDEACDEYWRRVHDGEVEF